MKLIRLMKAIIIAVDPEGEVFADMRNITDFGYVMFFNKRLNPLN